MSGFVLTRKALMGAMERTGVAMPKKFLPRIVSVMAGERPCTVCVGWERGGETLVDVTGLIETFKVYAPLRQSAALFRQVRVGEYGTDIVWSDELDMSADTLWRLAQEQSGVTSNSADDSVFEAHAKFVAVVSPVLIDSYGMIAQCGVSLFGSGTV